MNTDNSRMTLKELTELDLADQRRRFPNLPETLIIKTVYSDKTANALTKAVIRFLELKGHQAERISTQGTFIKGKVVGVGMYGVKQLQGKYVPTQGVRGSADISSIIKSNKGVVIVWKIEIKMKDSQSLVQKQYQKSIESAGGVYDIVRTFDQFYKRYCELIND